MKKTGWLVVLAMALVSAISFTEIAEAKRLGGGSSIGKQSSAVTKRAAPPPSQQAQQAVPAKPATPSPAAAASTPSRSKWFGPLAGLAAGLGLAALFSSLGFGQELAEFLSSALMIVLLAFALFFVWRLLRGGARSTTTPQPAYANGMMGANTMNVLGNEAAVHPLPSAPVRFDATATPAAIADVPRKIPEDFDVEGFLRHAKVYFIRLQAAWDAGNLNDIREFTTPPMFAEISVQIEERGPAPNQTDVVTLHAELLGVESTATEHIASARFYGMIREQANGPAEPFDEVWNLTKPAGGEGGWVLAGIQQIGLMH